MTQPATHTLIETISDWRSPGLEVDHQQRLVAGISLAGPSSANGYTYTAEALRTAVPLYESRPVFLDHATSTGRPLARSTRDLVGSVVNPRYEEGRIRADIRVLETEAGRTFLALAAAETPAVGMSHVVRATRSADLTQVEAIHEVISVDAVAFPATTSGFREHTTPPSPPPGSFEAVLPELDLALPGHVSRLAAVASADARRVGLFPSHILIESRSAETPAPQFHLLPWQVTGESVQLGDSLIPVPSERLTDSAWLTGQMHASTCPAENAPAGTQPPPPSCGDSLEESLTSLRTERDQLQTRLTELEHRCQSAERHTHVEELLRQSGLPATALTEVFRAQLLSAPDDPTRHQLIADRAALLAGPASSAPGTSPAPAAPSPFSSERLHSPASPIADSTLIAAIRRH